MHFEIPEFNARRVKGLALALAGLLLAFIAGRLSVWLVPPAGFYGSVHSVSKPSIPLEPDPIARFAAWTPKWVPPTEKSSPNSGGQPEGGSIRSSRADETEPNISNNDTNPTRDPVAVERCAARYRTFDPSDGTYRPFGRDERVLCRFLR